MGRRKRSSPAQDIMDLVALLPWWMGVALAVLSYWGLSYLATQPIVPAQKPADMGRMLTQGVWLGLAQVGQYLLPILCLGAQVFLPGAVASARACSMRQVAMKPPRRSTA